MRRAADEEALKARGVTGTNLNAWVTGERLARLAAHVATGTIRRPEVEVFPLEDAATALAQAGGHHVRGKVVLRVARGTGE